MCLSLLHTDFCVWAKPFFAYGAAARTHSDVWENSEYGWHTRKKKQKSEKK